MNSVLYKTIRLSLIIGCGVLFVLFAISNLLYLYTTLPNDNIWINDFFGLWSYAKFLLVRRFSEIYDNTILLDFQMDLGATQNACCLMHTRRFSFSIYYH
jgi:hypothetical protein